MLYSPASKSFIVQAPAKPMVFGNLLENGIYKFTKMYARGSLGISARLLNPP